MEKTIEKVSTIYKEQTTNTSSVARQIVFALFALIWAISYKDRSLQLDDWSYISLFILLGYLLLDIIQSIIAAITYRLTFKTLTKEESNQVDKTKIKKILDYVDNLTFFIFVFKVILVPCALVGIIKVLIKMI